jgi:hypothetical protein
MFIKNFLRIFSTVNLLILSACASHWNLKQWNTLEDRTFYLSKFYCQYTGNVALAPDARLGLLCDQLAKMMPVKEIVGMLSEKFNIKVDTTEFEKLNFNLSSSANFTKKGMLTVKNFFWSSAEPHKNEIALLFGLSYTEASVITDMSSARYGVHLNVNNKNIALFEESWSALGFDLKEGVNSEALYNRIKKTNENLLPSLKTQLSEVK